MSESNLNSIDVHLFYCTHLFVHTFALSFIRRVVEMFCRCVTTMLFYLLLFSIAHVGSKKRADNKRRMKGKWRTVLEIKQSLGKL